MDDGPSSLLELEITARAAAFREGPFPVGNAGAERSVLASALIPLRRSSMLCRRKTLHLAHGVALALLLALAGPATAQDSQYWDIQYGPVGQLLGGQIVGSARDLSATYYNPGGLALGADPDFLISVQAFKKQTLSLEPLEGGEFLNTADTAWGTFPGFVALAFPERWLGERTRLAFSVLTRQESILRINQRFAGDLEATGGRYGIETLLDQRMRETWAGLTVSRQLGERWGVGGTLYGVYRSQRTRWEQNVQATAVGDVGVSALVIDDFDYSHWRVLAKIGVGWEGRTVRLGAAVTTPSAALFGSGDVGFTRTASGLDENGDGYPDTILVNGLDEGLDSSYRSSWAFAGGGAWRRGSLQLHLSAEYFAAVQRFDVLKGQSLTADRVPVSLTQELESVLNAGVGVEYWLGGVRVDDGERAGATVLYGAFATDFTASPDVEVGEAATSNQNHFHVTAGTAFSVGTSRFTLGLSYAFGSKTGDLGVGGLPPGIPVIGEGRPVRTSFSRFVFLVGFLFG